MPNSSQERASSTISEQDTETLNSSKEAGFRESSCNICGSQHLDLVSEVDRQNKPLRTVICKGCGLVFTQQNRITDLRQFYTEDYRGHIIKPPLKHILRHGSNALNRYDCLKNHLKPGQKVLDIGSGNGEFVCLLSSLGFKAKGVEPHKGLASYSKEVHGIEIEVNFLEDFAVQSTEKFDLVTLFHVLEHKDDPSETLSIIHDMLNPDGLCLIEVPDISAYSVTPKNLFHIDHLYNFNETTLIQLGLKTGFSVIDKINYKLEGNILLILKKSKQEKAVSLEVPENYQRVYTKLKSYTNFKHYCSLRPYVRALNKLGRRLYERLYTSRFTDGKVMLDTLYKTRTKNLRNK